MSALRRGELFIIVYVRGICIRTTVQSAKKHPPCTACNLSLGPRPNIFRTETGLIEKNCGFPNFLCHVTSLLFGVNFLNFVLQVAGLLEQ